MTPDPVMPIRLDESVRKYDPCTRRRAEMSGGRPAGRHALYFGPCRGGDGEAAPARQPDSPPSGRRAGILAAGASR